MAKTFYTIDDLYNFCKENHFEKFSSVEKGAPLIVQSFGEIKTSDTSTMGLTPCTLMACHTGLNLNKSFISDESMNNALKSFSNRPILGFIHQLDDETWDFGDHRISIEEDGDDTRVEYLEKPIGVIPESCNAHLEYDKENDKKYVVVDGYIYDDYGNRALDIIKNNDGKVSVSVELAINEMSFNAKENYLVIEDFTFLGVTCLGKNSDGTEVKPGMAGSNLKLDNFSANQNSMFSTNIDCTQKLVETLEKLNMTLSSFHKTTEEGGGIEMDNNFENTVVADEETKATEEAVEETTNEETSTSENNEVVETEACGKKKKCSEDDEDPISTEEEACGGKKKKCEEEGSENNDEDPKTTEQEACGGKKKKCSIEENGDMTVSFEISHDDIRNALYVLIEEYNEIDNDWYYIVEVYDSYFIMGSWDGCTYYKQSYIVEQDNVSLSGERVQVFAEFITESEKIALDKLRGDYAELEAKYNELKTFKDNYDADALKAQKDEVFANASYDVLAGNESFEDLKKNAEKFSLEEITTKAKLIFADYVQSVGSFAAKTVETEQTHKVGYNFNAETEEEYAPYGSILPAKKKKKK